MNIPFNNKIFFAYKFSECDYLQQTRFLFDYDSLMNDVNNKLLYYKSAPALVPDNDLYKVVLTKIDKIKKLDNNISFLERTIEKEYKYRNESLKKRLYFPELNKEESNFDNCIEIMFLIRKPDYIPVINELIETKESCTQKEINNLLIPFINEYYKLNLNDSYIDKFRLIYNDFFSYQIYIELLILKLEDLKTLKSQNEYDNSKKMEFIKSLEEYKNSKNKYDFSNYLFNHNEEFVLLFSNQLESNEDKITYLKYVYSLTKDKPDYSTQLIKSEIIKFKNIIKYENMKKKTIKKETKTVLKNPEFKKAEKKIRKFVWNGTEEGILRIIDLLFNSGFLTKESYKIRNAIIRDSFQKLDENNQIIDFKNTQLSSVNSQRLKEEKIKADNKDYNKFINLQKGLKKVIPD